MTIKDEILKNNLNKILPENIWDKLNICFYKKGNFILEADCKVKNIYLILEGKVEISYILNNGNRIFINSLDPLEIFGDIEFVNGSEVLYDVVAIDKTKILLISFEVAEKYLKDNFYFWKFLAKEGNKKLLKTNKAILLKNTLPLKLLLIQHLVKNNYEIKFENLNDLAAELNVSYRNLTRNIKFLVEKNIIGKERKKITVIDKKRLLEFLS
ncbi:cAMP-binding domain of CRP or a regulatory subunit of cAMP-dependent protein kinases [Cetobacterium ceti]|uniref:cAMP-binding domain of CRP or a regulatory subunit of cAMP-dependent protein kinases n=1 Tax=Cetobacterium ceti TaxID=180163 RepID=A0A1T4MSD1_9FUSO|nr:Crp/Fnr family transcriptional regulator [Cetobacterium ceti]SJZ69675.1 cAMP-binding domain of CRP or a regulatory subunit of cAMP-dependent protein kinases [Cetobacterium ceti]